MKRYKQAASLVAISVTGLLFTYYWHSHPSLLNDLKAISPQVIVLVILLYIVMLAVLVAIYDTTLRLCKKTIPLKEHTVLTMYSSIINFFGPLQSGPGVRSIYLKQRHQVKLSRYAMVTLAYYFIFGAWSGLFLITGVRPLWKMAGVVVIMAFVTVSSLTFVKRLKVLKSLLDRASLKLLVRLALFTLAQVLLVSLVYFTELRSINSHISFSQALIYTGAANFALFVSLTPGALGFREAFLFFSQRLHHINGNTIVAANVIDRSAYVMFLGILLIAILTIQVSGKIAAKPAPVE